MSLILIIYIAFFLSMISHELGHYYYLQKYDVPVQEFTIGLGSIFFKKNGLILKVLPLHGSVRYDGQFFEDLNVPKKIKILSAGGLVNLIIFWMIILLQIFVTGYSETLTMASIPFFTGSLNLLPIFKNSDGFFVKKLIKEFN